MWIAPHWRGRSGAVCPMRVGVRKDGAQRTERFAGEEFGQKRAIPKCAPSEIVSSCSRPDSRKEPPSFFPENLFFTLSMINVRPPHLAGPPPLHPWGPRASSGPGQSQKVASSLNRLRFRGRS